VNILLYALAAVIAGVLAIRAPLGNRGDPVRRTYAVFCSNLCVCYLGFTLYLLLDLYPLLKFDLFKYVAGVAAAFLPPSLLSFVDTFFARPTPTRTAWLRELAVVALPMAVAYVAVDAVFYGDLPRASAAEVVFALYLFGGLGVSLWHLVDIHESAPNPAERTRVRYVGTLIALAVGFSAFEALVRSFDEMTHDISWLQRALVVQGQIPPFGAIFATVFLYFVNQVITTGRLLDIREVFSRLIAVAAGAGLLVTIDALSVATLVGPDYPVHIAFQVFLASTLFLLGYEPLRKQVETWAARVLNRRGQRLHETLAEMDDVLSRVLAMDTLVAEVQNRLLVSGRVGVTTVYLWDEDRRSYRLVDERGEREEPAILQVARQPFTDGFATGARAYHRPDLERVGRADPERREELEARLRLMAAMNAEVVLPFTSGDVVLGWIALGVDPDGEGFTGDEVQRLAASAARASVILENLLGFEKLKEEHRLAALGTMAAGLAHEIRNPLAGIKGAAQFLQGSRIGADAEMVRVIIDEVDRLSSVVTAFLDYARPFQVNADETSAHTLFSYVTGVLRMQSLPEGVVLVDDAPLDLPPLVADTPKLTQVLLNLCQNGFQAMKSGGTLTLRARPGTLRDARARRAPAIEIVVEDTGTGIPAEDLDKLFVPFFTTRHDGTGLGLAISRRIVQAHGGELEVRSTVGVGSTFIVRLPLRAPTLPAKAAG
jgi:signal transduction histidine kinase